jgi:hypothetical protein
MFSKIFLCLFLITAPVLSAADAHFEVPDGEEQGWVIAARGVEVVASLLGRGGAWRQRECD